MLTNVGGGGGSDTHVKVVPPTTDPTVAVMILVPAVTQIADLGFVKPPRVAIAVFELSQVAWRVRSCCVPSENVPVAINPIEVFTLILGLVGFSEILTNVIIGGTHVRAVEPNTLPKVAVIDVLPVVKQFPDSVEVKGPTVATAVTELDQTTDPVISCCVPSLYVPVALNPIDVRLVIEGVSGVTTILTNEGMIGGVQVWVVVPCTPFNAALTCPEPVLEQVICCVVVKLPTTKIAG
jgi:hypothetical protein